MARTAWLTVLLAGLLPVLADDLFPKPGWADRPNPLASPDAVVGGEMRIFAHQSPKSLNYYLDQNSSTADVFGTMYETLLSMDPLSVEQYVPGLAERWSISDDKRTFTFWLSPRARWSDGRPITAEDVVWTFQAVMDPTNITGAHKVALEVFEPPVAIEPLAVRFVARNVHWRNLGALGGFYILPKHAYAGVDFNKVNYEFPVVSGPYALGEFKQDLYVTLKRRADWWNRSAPSSGGTGNFEALRFCYFAERENAYEAFKKGQIDLYPVYTARLWVNETTGERFERNWIVKQKVVNQRPMGCQGFAMNLRRPPFDDLNVRHAMALLLDRAKMNRTLMYDQYFLHRSYYEDLYDAANPCPNELTPFDKEQARALLRTAGWTVNPGTGKLEKAGRPFQFKFMTHDATTDRFLAIYSEDLKDVGIELVIDKKDFTAYAKDLDEFNFDMTWTAWGSGLHKDPEYQWSSKEADRPAGSNITGFRNAEVDALIEKQRGLFDVAERHAICRQIDRIAAGQYPYVLLWNLNYARLLYWNRFGTPKQVLSKYGDESAAYWFWWVDADADADLQDAMKAGRALPPRPAEVLFEKVFEAR